MTSEFKYEKNGLIIDYKHMMKPLNSSKFAISSSDLKEKSYLFNDMGAYIEERRRSGELGFMDLPYDLKQVDEIESLVESKRSIMDNLLVLGIGGSALGNIAINNALNDPFNSTYTNGNYPRIFVEDNIDPDRIHSLFEHIDWKRTVVNVITKSGTTPETMATFFIAKKIMQEKMGEDYRKHIVVTTDPEKGVLRRHAVEEGFDILNIPRNVGGRFSVLSPVGLFSACSSGIDLGELLRGAREMDTECKASDFYHNPAYLIAAMKYSAYMHGIRINVLMPYSSLLKAFSQWYCQLIGESLGKKDDLDGKICFHGITPVSSSGTTDQHSQLQLYVEGPEDKLIIFLFVGNHKSVVPIYDRELPDELSYFRGRSLNDLIISEGKGTSLSLLESGRLNFEIMIDEISPYSIGGLFYLFEMVTLIMGRLLNINAFDQPGVDRSKILTREFLRRKKV